MDIVGGKMERVKFPRKILFCANSISTFFCQVVTAGRFKNLFTAMSMTVIHSTLLSTTSVMHQQLRTSHMVCSYQYIQMCKPFIIFFKLLYIFQILIMCA
jgi:hypothetical protein